MARRVFDRYMVRIGMGTHPRLATLSDSEFRAHVVGVLAIAAMSPVRGRLLVGDQPAEPVHVARAAGVTERVAVSALRKLMGIGVLIPDAEYDCLRVHHWEDVNPPPKNDPTATERQRRHRSVTPLSRRDNAPVTPDVTPPEVEVEVEVLATQVNNNASLRSAVIECFAYWQEKCGHPTAKLSPDRKRKIEARLREGYTVHDIRQAIEGAARAAHVSDEGKRYDDIELICRSGSKLEDFMGRVNARVVPINRGGASREIDPEQRARTKRKLTVRQVRMWVRNGVEDPAEIRRLEPNLDESVDLEAEIAAAKAGGSA